MMYCSVSLHSIGGTIFTNQLRMNLVRFAPGLPADLAKALEQSVTTIKSIDPPFRAGVLNAYVRSVDRTFLLGVPAGVLASLSAMYVFRIFGRGLSNLTSLYNRMVRNISVKEALNSQPKATAVSQNL